MNIHVLIAYRGDHLDTEAKNATLQDNPDDLSRLNQRIQQGNGIFRAWAEGVGGRSIAQMGDGGVLEVSADRLSELPTIQSQYEGEVGTTASVGVGVKLSEAEQALEYAIKTGGNSVQLYTEELAQDLAALDDPNNQVNVFASYLDKAEPALNNDKAGGGMSGASQPSAPSMGKPSGEGSEHSENEALQSMLADQPPAAEPPDMAGQFDQLAQQSEASENEQKQAQAQQAQEEEDSDNLRGAIVDVLKQFKEQAPLWEQLKEAQPEAYKTLTGVIQAMIGLAKQAYGGEGQLAGEGEAQDAAGNDTPKVQKSEVPLAPTPMHNTVEGFMKQLTTLPKVGPERGKFVTSHMNHGPFIAALQTHPQGAKIHATLTHFLNGKANAGVGVGAKVMVKALPKGAKLVPPGPYDIGDQTENIANRAAFPGSAEHAVMEDTLSPGTGKKKVDAGPQVRPVRKIPVKQSMYTPGYDAASADNISRSFVDSPTGSSYGAMEPAKETQWLWKPTFDEKGYNDTAYSHNVGNAMHDRAFWQKTGAKPPVNPTVGIAAPDRAAWERSPLNRNKVKKAEDLAKRSKNVREQTRNITPEQADARVAQYANKMKVSTHAPNTATSTRETPFLTTSADGRPQIENRPSGDAFTGTHELGHLAMMPPGRTPEDHQQWMDGKTAHARRATHMEPKFGDNWHRHYPLMDRTSDEGASAKAGIMVGRRAGIPPQLADPEAVSVARHTNANAKLNYNDAAHRMKLIDNGIVGFKGNKLTPLSSIHAKINAKVFKAGLPMSGVRHALEAGKTGHHQVVLPVGSQLDAGPLASRNVGRIKIADPDTGNSKWRQVRAGMIMAPDGSATSSRNPNPGGKDDSA